MRCKINIPTKGYQQSFLIFASASLILTMLVGCGPSTGDLESVEFTPQSGDDWKVSNPADTRMMSGLYCFAIGTNNSLKDRSRIYIIRMRANGVNDCLSFLFKPRIAHTIGLGITSYGRC